MYQAGEFIVMGTNSVCRVELNRQAAVRDRGG